MATHFPEMQAHASLPVLHVMASSIVQEPPAVGVPQPAAAKKERTKTTLHSD
jgi:hypothetical protein